MAENENPGTRKGSKGRFLIRTGLELMTVWAATDTAGGIWKGLILILMADLAWDLMLYFLTGQHVSSGTMKEKADSVKKAEEKSFPLRYAFMLLFFALVRILA